MNLEASLIIPAYNAAPFIADTLNSVKSQSLDPNKFETIIIDDGSIDETSDIIRRVIDNTPIIYRSRENKGQPATTNETIDMANGRYIILLDADDLLEPHALEATLNFMNTHPEVRYSYSQHVRIDENGNFLENRPGYSFSKERLLHYNFVGHIKCFTRELHQEIGGFNESFHGYQDWDHVLRASELLDENQIAQNPMYLYKYRIHENQAVTAKERFQKGCIQLLNNYFIRNGMEEKTHFSHITKDKYTYYDWKLK